MRTLIKGKIEKHVPFFNGFTNEDGVLVIQEGGNLSLTVDTGFNGAIALPKEILDKMNVNYAYYTSIRLADDKEIEVPLFVGKVMIWNYVVETWFIYGLPLLGIEFLSFVGSLLSLDFKKKEVKLLK